MSQYAGIFTRGMKRKWAHLAYLDLFAGPGRFRVKPRGQFDDGSPLIALGLGFTHYFLSDLSPAVTSSLDVRARSIARPDQHVVVRTGDANALANEWNAEVRRHGLETLAFAVLDPPGPELRDDAIAALTAGLPMDLLIFFPLFMNIQRQAHYRLADPVNNARWDAYFGTDEWRRARTARARYELYLSQLQKLGYQYFGDSKLIRDRRVVARSERRARPGHGEGRKLYVLISASKHKLGKEFFNKATIEDHARQRDLFRALK
jgi:three-Cys-motif partner protein